MKYLVIALIISIVFNILFKMGIAKQRRNIKKATRLARRRA